ncbi:MAG: response regulator [Campylobacterales bacterium]|nr:response regulator [Campylobacterales bacterium]
MNPVKHEKAKIMILVVEDSLTQAEEVRYFLESYDYTVAIAHDGEEALEWLQNSDANPDVIVSDVVMPRMDGYEFCKAIRANERFKNIPVILLTSLSEPHDIIKSIEAGANKFLTKPFDHKRLPEVIDELYINTQRRSVERMEMGIRLMFGGNNFLITADKVQILDLLLSSYEDSYYKNIQLQETRSELEKLNSQLEEKVQERTTKLKEKEKQFRTLTEHTPDLIVRMDRNENVVYINKVVEDLFGITHEQLIGQSTSKLDEIFERFCTHTVTEVFTNGKEIKNEMEVQTLQGKRWFGSVFVPEYNDEGEIEYVLKVSRDITTIKEYEAHLIHQKDLYQALSRTNGAIIYSKTEQELFDAICQIAIKYGKFTYCWIATIDPTTHEMKLQSIAGGNEAYILDLKTLLHKKGSALLDSLEEERALICNDINDPAANLMICKELAEMYGTQSFANFRLFNGSETYAILTLCSDQKAFFDEEIEALLNEMVGDISFALKNFNEVKWRTNAEITLLENKRRISDMLIDTVAAISTTIEMRDPYTAGHQKRVSLLACAIAKEMGLSQERIEGLSLAAQIHDVGKIQIPAEILSKPTKLGDLEFLMIQTHPETGYSIVKDIEFPWPIATMIRQHHEKLDGSGYPHGLRGEAILLEARILTVADIVEAMESHRPYRPALGIEAAITEIQNERGTKLDSDVVDACIRLFKEERFSFSQ